MMLEHNGHRIEVTNSWLGLERVSYDGGEVARRRTLSTTTPLSADLDGYRFVHKEFSRDKRG